MESIKYLDRYKAFFDFIKELGVENHKKLIDISYKFIEYINNPSEEVQAMAVNKNVNALQLVDQAAINKNVSRLALFRWSTEGCEPYRDLRPIYGSGKEIYVGFLRFTRELTDEDLKKLIGISYEFINHINNPHFVITQGAIIDEKRAVEIDEKIKAHIYEDLIDAAIC